MKNLPAIIKAGLIAGTLDILAAFIQYFLKTGKNPDVVLKFIASGVFGVAAFNRGPKMSVCGLVFHYFIAFAFTFFFFWIVPKIHFLLSHRILTGIVYGIFIWLVMQLIVLPLSNTPKSPLHLTQALIAIAILIACIGLPLSFMAGEEDTVIEE